MPDERRRALYDFEPDGFQAHLYEFPGQWGTHVDAPVHFCEGGIAVDAIPVEDMLLPLVVIDIRSAVTGDPDYCVSLGDIENWESRNGLVPENSFVALRSGWSARWPDNDAMQNKDTDGVRHFPGWSIEVLGFLVDERGITACGHETTDTDSGVLVSRDEFPAETFILERGHYQIEMLADMTDLPESGGVVVCSFPKPRGGSGFPARVFAIT
jgi:kynurenine formamidase